MSRPLRILFLSDTHLGFDMPAKPRVEKRRRGPDFYRNFALALESAVRERVDLVIHGGDVFHRSRVRSELVLRALDLVRPVTEAGIPLVIVPGNHERSALPLRLLWTMPNLHVFDGPETKILDIRGVRVAITGFPFHRRDIRASFPSLIRRARPATLSRARAPEIAAQSRPHVRLLCLHHSVEGAQVGPSDYMFRSGRDIIPGRFIPRGYAAVLSGHIHRAQTLRHDLAGRPLACPVYYPGSTERTAFAEQDEAKGYLVLDAVPGPGGGSIVEHAFRELPARPMEIVNIPAGRFTKPELRRWLRRELARLHPDAVVRVRSHAESDQVLRTHLSAVSLRALAPSTQSIDWRSDIPQGGDHESRGRIFRNL